MGEAMLEEEHPICKIEMVNINHTPCQDISQEKVKNKDPCRPVMKCKLDMVKHKKEKHEAKICSFHPKTICKPSEGRTCKMVKRKMSDYRNH